MKQTCHYALLLLAISASGCYSVRITDNLASDSQRGYVQFYMAVPVDMEAVKLVNNVYRLNGEQEQLLGPAWDGGGMKPYHARRIACQPGQEEFVLEIGNFHQRHRVSVKVLANMVTPILMSHGIVKEGGHQLSKSGARYSYTLTVEDPKPLTWKPARKPAE